MIDSIPKEILLEILFKLDIRSRMRLAECNKKLNNIADGDDIWKKHTGLSKADCLKANTIDGNRDYYIVGEHASAALQYWPTTYNPKLRSTMAIFETFPVSPFYKVYKNKDDAIFFAGVFQIRQNLKCKPIVFTARLKDKMIRFPQNELFSHDNAVKELSFFTISKDEISTISHATLENGVIREAESFNSGVFNCIRRHHA